MVICSGGTKGGTGKTTIAINLAVAYARQGKRICLLDGDEQKTTYSWGETRRGLHSGEVATVTITQTKGQIGREIEYLKNDYDHLIIDLAGIHSDRLNEALNYIDFFLVPIPPTQQNMINLNLNTWILRGKQSVHPHFKARYVLSIVPTNPQITENKQAIEFLRNYNPLIQPLKTWIYNRKIYNDAFSQGYGVTELDNPKAKSEINLLAREIQEVYYGEKT